MACVSDELIDGTSKICVFEQKAAEIVPCREEVEVAFYCVLVRLKSIVCLARVVISQSKPIPCACRSQRICAKKRHGAFEWFNRFLRPALLDEAFASKQFAPSGRATTNNKGCQRDD